MSFYLFLENLNFNLLFEELATNPAVLPVLTDVLEEKEDDFCKNALKVVKLYADILRKNILQEVKIDYWQDFDFKKQLDDIIDIINNLYLSFTEDSLRTKLMNAADRSFRLDVYVPGLDNKFKEFRDSNWHITERRPELNLLEQQIKQIKEIYEKYIKEPRAYDSFNRLFLLSRQRKC